MGKTVVPITQGGTGQVTNTLAFNALAPATPTNKDGLIFNGTNWVKDSTVFQSNELRLGTAMGSALLGQNYPVYQMMASVAMVSQTIYLNALYLDQPATLTGLCLFQLTQGVYTGNNQNRVGLYTASGGTLTLVASNANAATLWSAGSPGFKKFAFSSTYAAAAGLYYFGYLYSSSAQTTAPAIGISYDLLDALVAGLDFTNSNGFYFTKATQTTLPATVAANTLARGVRRVWGAVY